MDEEKGIYYTNKKLKNIKLNSFLNGAVVASFVYLIVLLLVIYSLHLVINRFGKIGKDENVAKLMTVLQLYDEVYVGDIEIDKMVDGAISTITEVSGDKYGHYIPSYNADTSGQMYSTGSYEGIGFSYLEYFNLDNPYIEVVAIVEDSPAGRSSMKIGDKITHINGEIISEEVITNFKKSRKEGSIKNYVFRLNDVDDVEITVGMVKEPILDYEIVDNVAFIHIYDFVPETSNGKTVVSIDINTLELEGAQLVITQVIKDYYTDGVVLTHNDLEDADQTVTVGKILATYPDIETGDTPGGPGAGKDIQTGVAENAKTFFILAIISALFAAAGVGYIVYDKKRKTVNVEK
jgi:membrane-associated protease RseP (regulator of RpoE activity)